MNRTLAASACALFVLFASSASAETIDISSVGGKDLKLDGYNGGNSEQAEQDYLFNYLLSLNLGYSASDLSYQKIDLKGTASFVEVTGDAANENLWAIDFADFGLLDPILFLVKVGNAQYDHYLYQNVESLQYGVIDLAAIPATRGNVTISSLSHTSAAVPEPATLSLLALGIGVGVASRKRRKLA